MVSMPYYIIYLVLSRVAGNRIDMSAEVAKIAVILSLDVLEEQICNQDIDCIAFTINSVNRS